MKSLLLHVRCPKCKTPLKDELHLINGKPAIKVEAIVNGERGALYLSSIWNDFTWKSLLPLKKDAVVEFYCPHCNRRLISEKKCMKCNSWMVTFELENGEKAYICSKVGCNEHILKVYNHQEVRQRITDEFGIIPDK